MLLTKLLVAGLLATPLVLPARAILALDAETRALEQAALCQAMPYREECGGKPAVRQQPPQAPAPPATHMGLPLDPATGKPVYTPPASDTTTPRREDFIRAASLLCLADMERIQSMFPRTGKTELYIACLRAYLAREGITIP